MCYIMGSVLYGSMHRLTQPSNRTSWIKCCSYLCVGLDFFDHPLKDGNCRFKVPCCFVVDRLSVFHFLILFSVFSFILSHVWQRAFLVNQTISHLISVPFSSFHFPERVLQTLHPPFPPPFCCCAVSSLGWWSNQCSNQTWAKKQ